MGNLKAKFKTKSNYKNSNGQWLEVVEISGKRISCSMPEFGFGNILSKSSIRYHTADFDVSEIVEFNNGNMM